MMKPGRKLSFSQRLDRLRGAVNTSFGDELRFLRHLARAPREVGAVLPTGAAMAGRMAAIVRPEAELPVLELGPGTGVITKAILARGLAPEKLVCVEHSPAFARLLRGRFPSVTVVEGDAFALKAALGPLAARGFDCVVSALPLLNFPPAERERLMAELVALVPDGRPVVQFSYGPRPPVPARPGRFTVGRLALVLRNVPPAQVWLYRRAVGGEAVPGEDLRFLRGWLDDARGVGTPFVTGRAAARKMASVIDLSSGRRVLETGAGTGAITRAILATGLPPERLVSVERAPAFAAALRQEFPGIEVVEGDAEALGGLLDPDERFDCVISAVPLLNLSPASRIAYIDALLDRLPAGRPVVQITHGPLPPAPRGGGRYRVEHLDFIVRNVPPAQLWTYRRM